MAAFWRCAAIGQNRKTARSRVRFWLGLVGVLLLEGSRVWWGIMKALILYSRQLALGLVLLAIGCGCTVNILEASEGVVFELDEYGFSDRQDVIEVLRPFHGNLVFVRGRIMIDSISFPEAPRFGRTDGRIYPCKNNPFDVPLEEYPTRERVRKGLAPNPWYLRMKFVERADGMVSSVDMDMRYENVSPVGEMKLSEIHSRCLVFLGRITGEMDIASITTAAKLYIHNIYDTESNLEGVQQLRTP